MSLSCPLCPVPCVGLAPGRGWWDLVCESTTCFTLQGSMGPCGLSPGRRWGRCLAAASPNHRCETVGGRSITLGEPTPSLLRGQASWHVQAARQGGQLGSDSWALAGSGLRAGAHLRKGTGLCLPVGQLEGPCARKASLWGTSSPHIQLIGATSPRYFIENCFK